MASCGKNCINWWLCDEIGLNIHLHERDDVEKQCPYFFSRPEKKTVYWISCSTGCSCCADQNFDYGFYFNREDAAAQAEAWREFPEYHQVGAYEMEEK